MNSIYKVIWSKAKNCYVVASEIAKSHTKSASGSEKMGGYGKRALLALAAASAIFCGGLVNVGASVQSETISAGTTSNPVLTVDNTDDAAQLNKVISAARDDKLVTKDNISDQLTGYAKASDLSAKADATTVNDISTRVDKLETTVGNDASGLVKDVAEAKTDITNIKNTIGDDTTGLIKEVNDKANQSDLDAATDRITTAEDKITKLETQTGNLSTDGKSLTSMDAVSGTTVSGDTVKAGSLNVTGTITDGANTTTLSDIKNSMTQTESNRKDIATLKTTTGEQDTAIKDLQKKTTNISYADGAGTSIDGITVKNGNIVGNGNSAITGLTNVETSQINGKSLAGTTVATMTEVEAAVKAETDARTEADNKLEEKITKNSQDIATLNEKVTTAQGDIQTNAKNIQANSNAIADTNKRTGGIARNLEDTQTTIEGKVTVNNSGDVGGVKGLSAETIKTTGGAEIGGALTVTGESNLKNTTVGGALTANGEATFEKNVTAEKDLTVNGTLKTKDVTAETIHISKSENTPEYKSEGSIIGDGGKLSVSNEKTDKRTNITEKSELNVNEKGTVNWATSKDNATGNVTEGRSEVTADNIKNFVKKTEGGKTFGYEENITADGKVGTVTDKEGNTSSTRQDSKGIYGYAKDKDGNKSYTKQEGNRIAESVIGQDGKKTKSEMTSTDITNTAKDGTITNTAQNVTNEGTESVTNKVGANEVKVSKDGVDIKAEAGKKITESVGTTSRVVENDKITDKAADSTVTTENGKGTTFGKEGSTGTTNIYGDSIKTGTINANTINAKDTTTDKLTAGAAAGADGGRLTVDATDGVKGSYKSGEYTSKSYILKNTLKSGVDNGKEPTEDGFVGSRTDHYMDGDKAKLDETVKDADGSNVTNKTSTSSNNTIADTNGNANTVVSTVDGTKFTNTGANTAIGEGTVTDTTIKGNTITTGKVTMDYAEVMKDLGVTGKTTTGSLEVKGESKLTGNVTMENNATVGNDLTVKGITTTKTLKVTENAEIDGNATIKGDVTARSYKVGDKTYIDANGIHANGQKITDVADGSISEGSKDAVNGGQLYGVKNDLEGKVNKVGANAAAMANLHPMEFDPDSKWNIAAAIGNYGSETAAALGAFYRPNDDVMVNLSTAFGTGENMVGGGVSVRLGQGGNKLSREESNALKAQVDDLTARMDALLSVLNPNMSKDFPDVPENHWAYEAVSRLAGNDIVQGYPDGEFHGERTMTRYEMAEIIYNALSRGAEAERELVEEFKPELQAMAASEKATAERAEG